MKLKKILLIINLALAYCISFAQDSKNNTPYFLLSGRISVQSSSTDGVQILLMNNDKAAQSFMLNKSGKYELQLPYNKQFTLNISKNGFYPKQIDINTNIPRQVQQENIDFPPLTLNLQLIPLNDVLPIHDIAENMAQIAYNANIDNIEITYNLTDQDLKQRIVEAKAEQKILKAEANVANVDNDNNNSQTKQYEQLIRDANLAYNKADYNNALLIYKSASELMPSKTFATDRIAEIEMITLLLAEQQNINDKYTQIIASADQSFKKEQYQEAIAHYNDALKLKTNDTYASKQIQISEQLINTGQARLLYANLIASADQAFLNKDMALAKQYYIEAQALKIEQEYPTKRLADIASFEMEQVRLENLNQQYASAIKEGDILFSNQSYTEAIKQYQKALEYKLNDATAKTKIADANAAIDLKKLNSINEQYDSLIAAGDNALNNKNYLVAQRNYSKASELKANESYPKKQFERIERIKEAEYLAQLKWRYDSVINMADANFKIYDFQLAEKQYLEAIQFFPKEEYPKSQLTAIAELKQSVNAENQTAYNNYIKDADKLFYQKSYALAKYYYNKASGLIPWESYPKEQTTKITELSKVTLSESDKLKYKELLTSAEEAYARKDYGVSRTLYNQAIQLNPSDDQSAIKLIEIDNIIATSNLARQNENFNNLIKQADQAYNEKQYSVARSYYNQALNMKPNDDYSKNQLKKIHEIVNGN